MKIELSKTNSWHWLGVALIVSVAASAFMWQHVKKNHSPTLKRQQDHLQELRMLSDEQVETLNRQIDTATKQMAQLAAEIKASGVQPIPAGAASILTVKNEIDSELTAKGLRVVSSGIRVPVAAPAANAASAAPEASKKNTAAPATGKSYEETINSITDKKLLAMIKAEEKRRGPMRAQAPQKGEKAAPAVAGRASPKTAAAEKLPFKTENMTYEIEGDYKSMFLFLVGQSFKKPSYHLKDISISRAQDGGMRMTFVAQINYQEKG